MPEAQEEFQKIVGELLEVAMFENWLRFYFIHESAEAGNKQPELAIELPQKALTRIRELYPGLYPLAKKLDGKIINFETSRDAVLHHILEEMDGKTLAKGEAQQALQSLTFQIKLELFHTWEQMHEDQLDNGFLEFGAWKNLFARWLETPGAKELGRKLLAARQNI